MENPHDHVPEVVDHGSKAVAELPKADLHVHQELSPRLDRILARREGRVGYDWAAWRKRLVREVPAGRERLSYVGSTAPVALDLDDDDELFVARLVDLLSEAAADGARYVEVRVGNETMLRDGFMELFRTAEQEVQREYPRLRAEALATVIMFLPANRLQAVADGCVRAAPEGLAGVDFLYRPYDSEADWTEIYRLAERFAVAGLGITAHAGEVSTANIAAAVHTPGLTRIGHGIHAVYQPHLTDLLVKRGVTLECALSCNRFFGVTPDREPHPLIRLIEGGVSVTLATDDPVQVGTTIGQEYAIASSMGLSDDQLLDLTRNAIRAGFATPDRKSELFADLADDHPGPAPV